MFLLGKQSISRVVEADGEGEGEDGGGWGLGPTLPLCFHFLFLSLSLSAAAVHGLPFLPLVCLLGQTGELSAWMKGRQK
jgi:hypothetical protein